MICIAGLDSLCTNEKPKRGKMHFKLATFQKTFPTDKRCHLVTTYEDDMLYRLIKSEYQISKVFRESRKTNLIKKVKVI